MDSSRIHRICQRALVHIAWIATLAASCGTLCLAQQSAQWRKVFPVSLAEPVSLDVHLLEGDLQIAYDHEGEVSIVAQVQPANQSAPATLPSDFLVVKADGNKIEIQQRPLGSEVARTPHISYRIDLPHRTEVRSSLSSGKQTIIGVMGPINARADRGDIHISYVAKAVSAQIGTGNLFLEVIGERANLETQVGNISCARIDPGVAAETGDGDISLMVVGPSEAKVKQGTGRIEAGGVRGTLIASTDAGDLQVKAVPHDDWRLSSVSGAIRVELPSASSFSLDVMTDSGEVVVARDDLHQPTAGVRQLNQGVNGGGKRIEVRSKSGRITVS